MGASKAKRLSLQGVGEKPRRETSERSERVTRTERDLPKRPSTGGESRERACRGSGGEAPRSKNESAGESAWTQERAATRSVSSGSGRTPVAQPSVTSATGE